jgi:hypothetical protein
LVHSNIGLIYFKQEKYKEALVELNIALKIRKTVFGDEHSFTRKTQKNIDFIISKRDKKK